MPTITFAPYTPTKTSVLFAQKKSVEDVAKWNELWQRYSSLYSNYKIRLENLIKIYVDGKTRSRYPSIKNLSPEQEKEIITSALRDVIDPEDFELTSQDLIVKYHNSIIDFCRVDKDTKDIFGLVNVHWVFNLVSNELDYNIFFADIENIGYKRTKRSEKKQPNELFRVDSNKQVIVDDGVLETALDYLRQINW